MNETSVPEPKPAESKPIPRTLATVIFILATLAIFAYLFAVVDGKVPKEARLDTPEVGLAIVTCVSLILVIHPSALNRLNLVKLPLGIELTLDKLKSEQVEQRKDIDVSFSILSNLLSLPEKYHLRCLMRDGGSSEEYTGNASLREELYRLKRFGLIDEIGGQRIGEMFDGKRFDPGSYVHITEQGKKFLLALAKIES